MIFELRPHHIEFLGLRMRLSGNRLRDHTTLIREAYGVKMLDKINGIVTQLLGNKDSFVRVVEGVDDICKVCSFRNYCAAGQYDFVRRIFAERGWPLPSCQNPDESDKEYARKNGLVFGEVYSPRELFG